MVDKAMGANRYKIWRKDETKCCCEALDVVYSSESAHSGSWGLYILALRVRIHLHLIQDAVR